MRTLLIVDDIAIVRNTLKTFLEPNLYEVVGEASSGVQAVEKYMELKPDLVTIDLVMPGMNGIQTAKRILEKDPHAKIIVLSSMQDETLAADAIEAGAIEYIMKPFRADELLSALDRAMGERESISRPPLAAGR